jgi:hypothetical protein
MKGGFRNLGLAQALLYQEGSQPPSNAATPERTQREAG